MWMRSCALCKALLKKLRLCDSVRVSMRMGVAGSCIAKPGKRPYALGDRKTEGQELIVAKVIEFYIPSNFHKRARWIPTEQRGKLIEFCLPEKTRPAKVIEVRHRLLLQRSQTGSDG
jgi:hypothetical protein